MYEKAGVSIDEGNRVVDSIRSSIESTYTPSVIPNFGDFGGLFKVRGTDRILVASTDGVGTKTEHLRNLLQKDEPLLYRTLGQDIVNHCVNDILVKNARPLFFLDYFATSKLNHLSVKYLVEGISKACKATNTALLGGETAEMPSVYAPKAFDIAGTIVGETTVSTMFDGKSSLTSSTHILYLPSNGPHTNGYSLIRLIYDKIHQSQRSQQQSGITGEELALLNKFTTQPHRCYLDEVSYLQEHNIPIQALCHITGGGLIDNPERVVPSHLETKLDTDTILLTMPREFKLLQKYGDISDQEMLRVFNCGVGMLVYLDIKYVQKAQRLLKELVLIGCITEKSSE